jgi:phosphomannomutase
VLHPQIFKANDIRGIVGAQWDGDGAWALGRAYAELAGPGRVVVGRDMRVTSPELTARLIGGLTQGGVDVLDIGLSSTDGVWYASGSLGLAGIQVTSSHNPSSYNGLKLCQPGAQPVTGQFLADLARLGSAIDVGQFAPRPADQPGQVDRHDLVGQYAAYLLGLVDLTGLRRLTVVVDAGNGMGGLTSQAVLSQLNVAVVGLYLELDGTFPHHQPNPLEPQNLVDAQRAVVAHGADLGLVFDGDADRVFVIDERGQVVAPSAIGALIAVRELGDYPGATIVVNTVTSAAVDQIVAEQGGRTVRSKVGHTYMKAAMAAHDAVFGAEHSAHYYFRSFFGADCGMLAALHVMAALAGQDQPLSALVRAYTRYAASGEINSVVADQAQAMRRVVDQLGAEAVVDDADGVKIDGVDWWVSLRGSNTEPLLRLNVEARDPAVMAQLRDTVLRLVMEG